MRAAKATAQHEAERAANAEAEVERLTKANAEDRAARKAEVEQLREELAQRKREWDALKAAFVARVGRQEDDLHYVEADGTCGTCGLTLRACWCGKEKPPWVT